MSYPAGHRSAIRKSIVDSARRLFNQRGFEGVSLDEIMAGAGLTRGGFYSYFNSKSDLYVEVLSCFFTNPEWENGWEGVQVDLHSADAGAEVVRAYLSRQHFEDVKNSCPMVALPSDVTRSNRRAKRAFEVVFAAMVKVLEKSMSRGGQRAHAKARAIAAMCVGGMVVARALESRAFADELRDACMQVALELGEWTQGARRTRAGRSRASPRYRNS